MSPQSQPQPTQASARQTYEQALAALKAKLLQRVREARKGKRPASR